MTFFVCLSTFNKVITTSIMIFKLFFVSVIVFYIIVYFKAFPSKNVNINKLIFFRHCPIYYLLAYLLILFLVENINNVYGATIQMKYIQGQQFLVVCDVVELYVMQCSDSITYGIKFKWFNKKIQFYCNVHFSDRG